MAIKKSEAAASIHPLQADQAIPILHGERLAWAAPLAACCKTFSKIEARSQEQFILELKFAFLKLACQPLWLHTVIHSDSLESTSSQPVLTNLFEDVKMNKLIAALVAGLFSISAFAAGAAAPSADAAAAPAASANASAPKAKKVKKAKKAKKSKKAAAAPAASEAASK